MEHLNAVRDLLGNAWKVHLEGSTILTAAGAAAVTYLSYSLFKKVVWTPFKLYALAQVLPGVDLKKQGEWAVITGATDGLGKGYARELARRGMNIVLVSRSLEKLQVVMKEIKEEFSVEVKTITADFSRTDVYTHIDENLSGLDIGVLINNVGMGQGMALFLDVENCRQRYIDMININCTAMTEMCTIVMPQMVSKNRGVVINISSIAVTGAVGTTTYSATKNFVSSMSQALRRTYCGKGSGIFIHLLEPGMTDTPMLAKTVKEGNDERLTKAVKRLAVSVDHYVPTSLNTVGWSTDAVNGCLNHWLFVLMTKLRSQSSSDAMMYRMIKEMGLREKNQ